MWGMREGGLQADYTWGKASSGTLILTKSHPSVHTLPHIAPLTAPLPPPPPGTRGQLRLPAFHAGQGITLTLADTCIIYDSDWNPVRGGCRVGPGLGEVCCSGASGEE